MGDDPKSCFPKRTALPTLRFWEALFPLSLTRFDRTETNPITAVVSTQVRKMEGLKKSGCLNQDCLDEGTGCTPLLIRELGRDRFSLTWQRRDTLAKTIS